MYNIEEIKKIKSNNEKLLLSYPNVVGVGIGYKKVNGVPTSELSVVVSVNKKLNKLGLLDGDIIPSSIDGVSTDVLETGNFKINALTDKVRPLIPGYSIGHYQITAGTLGCFVTKNGEPLILSNNHVLANSNCAKKGDNILQPGPHDGGSDEDSVGKLVDFIPIRYVNSQCPTAKAVSLFVNSTVGVFNILAKVFNRSTRLSSVEAKNSVTNKVDCALSSVECSFQTKIYECGKPSGVGEVELGTKVKKSGRTTAYTESVIDQICVTVNVNYGEAGMAVFSDQLMTKAMSRGGDSGSVVLDGDNKVVGLLFAGSNNFTILNKIQNVFDSLKVELL